jgi:signal transduction histidine kinase
MKDKNKRKAPNTYELVKLRRKISEFETIEKESKSTVKKLQERLKQNQKMLEASEKELKSFSRRILSIREEEKINLSNILHDEVGCMAVALSSSLTGIEELIKNNNMRAALETSARAKSELKEFVSRLKKIAVDLRPPDLDIIGLTAALREYFSNVKKCVDIRINFSAELDEKKVDDKTAVVLYRVIQEALNNVIKHASANTMEVDIFSRANRIKLNLSDNGKGFNTEKSKKETGKHLGIRGMKEMIESLKGTFNIKSVRGKGTNISITIPMA